MIFRGPERWLQTWSCLAAEWFDSTLWAKLIIANMFWENRSPCLDYSPLGQVTPSQWWPSHTARCHKDRLDMYSGHIELSKWGYIMKVQSSMLFLSYWIFYEKRYNSFFSQWNCLNFWDVTNQRLITTVIVYSVSKFWPFPVKKYKSVNALWFFDNFYEAPMNLKVFV